MTTIAIGEDNRLSVKEIRMVEVRDATGKVLRTERLLQALKALVNIGHHGWAVELETGEPIYLDNGLSIVPLWDGNDEMWKD